MSYFDDSFGYTADANVPARKIVKFLRELYAEAIEAGENPRELTSIILGAVMEAQSYSIMKHSVGSVYCPACGMHVGKLQIANWRSLSRAEQIAKCPRCHGNRTQTLGNSSPHDQT